jgi:hypothetical protein
VDDSPRIVESLRCGETLVNNPLPTLGTTRPSPTDKEGNLYVSNRGDNTIRIFSPSGEDLGYFATTGMIGPVGLAFSPEPEDDSQDGEDGTLPLLVGSVGP